MPDYTIVVNDDGSGNYAVHRLWRGGTTSNAGGTEITSSVQDASQAQRGPFVALMRAVNAVLNDKAAGN